MLYGKLMEPKKALLTATLSVTLSVFCIVTLVQIWKSHSVISLETKGFPTVGERSAPVEVVLIEDFQCKNCRIFSQKVLPKLQKQYVSGGKVRFTLVPVSFLAGSQTIANALLEVYSQNPRHFFSYLKDILNQDEEIKASDLMRLAKRIKGINLERLQACIENGCHNKELERNLSWAQEIMGSQFRTPALYVNGAVGSTYSFEAIQYQIDLILGGK